MNGLLVLIAAYLIGGIPFGYLIVKMKSGRDVRSLGSGNIGATNVLRTTGRALGVLTLLLDIGKGALAVWIADRVTHGSPGWMAAAALAVMAGHAFPIFLKFQGGKAVASFVGAFLYLDAAAAGCHAWSSSWLWSRSRATFRWVRSSPPDCSRSASG